MQALQQFLIVGCGGFLGSGLRFALGSAAQKAWPEAVLPLGTLAVNVLGCLLIGLVAAARDPLEPALRLFLLVGVLGGFTTFSAFALETFTLADSQSAGLAVANVLLQVGLSLAAAWVGFYLGRLL